MKTTFLAVLVALSTSFAGSAEPQRIRCQVDALSTAEWAHLKSLSPRLATAVAEKVELPDGYRLRLAPDALPLLGEWAWYVVRCCPAVDYKIEIGPATGGALWLQLGGGERVKEFVSLEFAKLLGASASR